MKTISMLCKEITNDTNIDECLDQLNQYKQTKKETCLVKALEKIVTEIKNSPISSPNITPNSSFTNLSSIQDEQDSKFIYNNKYMNSFSSLKKEEIKDYLYRGC